MSDTDVAIVGMVERADDLGRFDAVAKVHERPQLFHFRGADHPERRNSFSSSADPSGCLPQRDGG